jgi:PadR family transcriptional regulator PadR
MRPGGIKRELLPGFVRLHILHHAAERPVYGLWMIEELRRHGYELSPGTVYPILHAMERAGYLERATELVGGKVRHNYTITEHGRTALTAARERLKELAQRFWRGKAVIRPVAAAALMLLALTACAPPSLRVSIYSDTHAFEPAVINVPAGERFILKYTNDEPGAEHNIALYIEEGGEAIAVSDSIVGPDAVTEVEVQALDPGTYYFQCDIHPFMNGILVAGE